MFACLTLTFTSTYYDINKISFEEQKCRALPFFYALTGCDVVSSFYNHGKCKFWDRWFESEEEEDLTKVFINLSEKPESIEEDQISVIERFVGLVYHGKHIDCIDSERLRDFEHSTHSNLKLIPPSRSGLRVENVALPLPSDWGWKLIKGQYCPVWDSNGSSIDADLLTSTCGCATQKCSKCKCATSLLRCIPLCKCQRNCVYKSI